jgi:hypothetical protein
MVLQPPPLDARLMLAPGPTLCVTVAWQESDALAASSRDPWGAAEAEQQVAAGRQPPAPAGLHLWPEQELVHEAEPEEEELQEGGSSGGEGGAAAGPDVHRCVGGLVKPHSIAGGRLCRCSCLARLRSAVLCCLGRRYQTAACIAAIPAGSGHVPGCSIHYALRCSCTHSPPVTVTGAPLNT